MAQVCELQWFNFWKVHLSLPFILINTIISLACTLCWEKNTCQISFFSDWYLFTNFCSVSYNSLLTSKGSLPCILITAYPLPPDWLQRKSCVTKTVVLKIKEKKKPDYLSTPYLPHVQLNKRCFDTKMKLRTDDKSICGGGEYLLLWLIDKEFKRFINSMTGSGQTRRVLSRKRGCLNWFLGGVQIMVIIDKEAIPVRRSLHLYTCCHFRHHDSLRHESRTQLLENLNSRIDSSNHKLERSDIHLITLGEQELALWFDGR